MRIWTLVLATLSSGVLSFASGAAIASTIEMRPYLADNPQQIRCPDKVMAYQTPEPYREGGYSTNGTVKLQAIATQIAIAQVDPYSVTWVGALKAPYQKCKATAGMAVVDGKPYTEHSYLRLRFLNGKVYFILDMTGLRDANSFTSVILKKEIQRGNPRWTWGGTD
jgi:hypothetical protein